MTSHRQLMKDPDYARQVREGEQEDRNYRSNLFQKGMKTPTMKAISEKGKVRQSVSDKFHKGIEKHGFKSKALDSAKGPGIDKKEYKSITKVMKNAIKD